MYYADRDSSRSRVATGPKVRDIRSNLLPFINTSERSASDADEENNLLKLPALEIPRFDVKLTKWATIKAHFNDFISDDHTKNNDQAKRRFLFRALSAEALSMVENLRDCNFVDSWQILVEYYDDPYRRANLHYVNMFSSSEPMSLHKRLVVFQQNSAGLLAVYSEINLVPMEQVMICAFLE